MNARPRILDLFCGAGGAAVGYARAGFDVVGVDIEPQPRYPFEFWNEDAIALLGGGVPRYYDGSPFDAVHASPPCQFATAYRHRKGVAVDAPNLIPATREGLAATGLPYVIENVEPARPWLRDPIRLCGSSFGLDVRRHRLFESNVSLIARGCDHGWQTARFAHATNRTNLRRTVEVGVWRIPLDVQQQAMGVDWMTLPELSQAIPPAYCEFIGGQLLAALPARSDVQS